MKTFIPIKQNKIAEKAGISGALLSQILSGKRRPSWRTARGLTAAVPGTTDSLWLEGTIEEMRQAISQQEAP